MAEDRTGESSQVRGLHVLAMVNAGVWAISIIGLVFVMQHSPGARGLFPILAGGTAVATALIATATKCR